MKIEIADLKKEKNQLMDDLNLMNKTWVKL